MGSGRDLLSEDEELLAEVRPHVVLVLGPALLFLAAMAAAVAIAIHFPNAPIVVAWLLAAMVVLPALWAFGRVLRWRSVRFSVTSTRLLYRRGVFGRDVVQLRLQRVSEVHCSQTLFGRMIGCGRLVFEVPGGDGPLVVEDVRWPRRLQRIITAQLDHLEPPFAAAARTRAGGRRPSEASWHAAWPADDMLAPVGSRRTRTPTDTPPHGVALDDVGASSVPGQILQLDELRRRGILSEQEFAAKKAELLSRL